MVKITETGQELIEGVHYSIPRTHFYTELPEQRSTTESKMPARELTFEKMAEILAKDATPQVAKNLISALGKFVEWRGMSMSDVVGRLLRTDFYQCRKEHLSDLHLQGRTPAYINNRSSLLSRARAAVLQLDRLDALNSSAETPLQTALHELVSKFGGAELLSRRAQIPRRKLEGYLQGTVPGRNGDRELEKIERYCEMHTGSLTALISAQTRRPWSRSGRRVQAPKKQDAVAPFSKHLAACRRDPYHVKASEVGDILRGEWLQLLKFKTDLWGTNIPSKGKLSRRWTCLPFPNRPPRRDDWVATVNGEWCPSARMSFEMISNVLGWLIRDPSKGGDGMPRDKALTMAWLADPGKIRRFIDWFIARTGGVINGTVWRVLTLAAAFCQPERGFLWFSEEIGARAGHSSFEWKQRCANAFAAYRLAQKNFKPRLSQSRNPFDRIASIIAMDEPMKAVWDALDRMKRDRPPSGGEAELVWVRNYLLVGLLASNPLRRRNILELDWRDDNTGHLRRDPCGNYRIFFKGVTLKNRYGRALSEDYDVPVQADLTPFIDEYLKKYWPKLTRGETNRIFVQTINPGRTWQSLGDTFFEITSKYFVGSGFRPHAMRHITATSLVKETGGFTAAALVLHDKEETVKKHYGFVIGNDGARWMEKLWRGGRKGV
jgi:integrase